MRFSEITRITSGCCSECSTINKDDAGQEGNEENEENEERQKPVAATATATAPSPSPSPPAAARARTDSGGFVFQKEQQEIPAAAQARKKLDPVESDFNKQRFVSFYKKFYNKHDPDMLAKIDAMLEEWAGKEEELFSKLAKMHGENFTKPWLIEFYMKRDTTKLDAVDATLESYEGKELMMFKFLNSKYGATASPPSPSSPPPPPQARKKPNSRFGASFTSPSQPKSATAQARDRQKKKREAKKSKTKKSAPAPRKKTQTVTIKSKKKDTTRIKSSVTRSSTDDEKRREIDRINNCRATDYFNILGVDSSADEQSVFRMYRTLLMVVHPDKCKIEGVNKTSLNSAFRNIKNAYDTLKRWSRR